MKAIGKIIKHLKPNVISLNEVTRENLALLGSQSWFGKYTLLPSGDIFQTMPADLNEEDIHTVAVLTNLPRKEVEDLSICALAFRKKTAKSRLAG